MTDPMTDRELAGCPFCGGKNVEAHHAGTITYLLCGDQYGRGGCGAVVSFRPNLAGSAAIAAWNRRTPSSEGDGRDGERLDWLCAVDPARRVEGRMGFRAYEDVAPLDVEHSHWVALTDRFYGTAREAIDAAMEKERSSDICPNCVSPWKCNGPHIGDAPANEYEDVR